MSNEAEHIRAIYRLLFDLATGRRLMRVGGPSLPYGFDLVRQRVFAIEDDLHTLALKSTAVPSNDNWEQIAVYVFLLNAHYRIIDVNCATAERLGYPLEILRQRLFETLLNSDTVLEWRRYVSSERRNINHFSILHLLFVTATGLKLPLICAVSHAVANDWVFVVSVDLSLEFIAASDAIDSVINAEGALFEAIHGYLLSHLEDVLPTLEALASKYGITIQTLQRGFKHYYGTTIYQFYQEERLKHGYHLILTTRLQLKEIAYRCGYSAYINFYKAFKKTYGIAPSELLRP